MTNLGAMRKPVLTTLLLLLTTGLAAAQNSTTDVALAGVGTNTCADFISHVRQSGEAENFYFAWALGFMSGTNKAPLIANQPSVNLAGKSADFLGHIRSYCESKPQDQYFQAVDDLLRKLPKSPPPPRR